MWITKHLRLSRAYSELERLSAERTAELQRLSQRLLNVQDEERRKLARDLHDSTGQTLAALKIRVSQLQEGYQDGRLRRRLFLRLRNWLIKPSKKFEPCLILFIRHCWTKWDLPVRPSGTLMDSPREAGLT